MILTLNDSTKTASVQDWDQVDWGLQKDSIPWDYTIEFIPMIDGDTLDTIRNGREVHYDQRTVYVTEWIGNTMIVRPQTIYVQQLLPLPSDPSEPSGT
jgi:hypothetical protein